MRCLPTLLLGAALLSGAVALKAQPLDIGSRKQLFIDSALISSSANVSLVMNPPIRDPEPVFDDGEMSGKTYSGLVQRDINRDTSPVVEPLGQGYDLLWSIYNQIIYDQGRYRLWYQARRAGNLWIAYAESKDGVNWTRPNLGLVEISGSKENNIIFPKKASIPYQIELGSVFIDTNPSCPKNERYKMIVRWYPPGGKKHGVWVLASADGIRFSLISDKQSFRDSDTGNVCFWDERIGKYVAYVRWWEKRQAPRVVCRCEFDDLRDWGREMTVLSADSREPKEIDFYTNAAVKYEGVYLMFPSTLHNPTKEERAALKEARVNYGWMDVQFATSRDGVFWNRPDRRPFLALNEFSRWDSAMLYMFTGLVVHEDEIWMYYWGRNYPHEGAYPEPGRPIRSGFGRLRLRLDGFMSADARYDGGELVTLPVTFSGNRMELNIQTSVPGHARVEILDMNGCPVPGFSAGECEEIRGNFIRKTVAWNGGTDLSALSGKPVRLRFLMRDAKLYAFRFPE